MSLAECLERFDIAAREWRSIRPLSTEFLTRETRPLASCVKALETAVPVPRSRRQSTSLMEARRGWKAVGRLDALSHREIGALCGDPETASDPKFVEELRGFPDLPRKALWIAALVQVYAQRWQSVTNSPFETLVRASLQAYSGRNPWINRLRPHAPSLVSPEAAGWVAGQAVHGLCPVATVLDRLGLTAEGMLASYAQDDLGDRWSYLFKTLGARLSDPDALKWLHYLTNDVLGVQPTPKAFGALETAVLSNWPEKSPAFRQALQSFILSSARLGDPRLPAHRPNWTAVRTEARAKVLSWLARESVQFFFETLLPKRAENRDRGQFWLRYYRRIVDFRVAASWTDNTRLRALAKESVPQYSLTDHDTTSAFVMRLQSTTGNDLVVVEFSETGNAAYFYDAARAIKRLGTLHEPRFAIKKDLKATDNVYRLIHRPGWEPGAADELARKGIRP